MDYISQIRTLAGHGNFQIFEHFIRVVAEIIFKGSVLEEPRDRDALNDFLVLKPDGRHAVIEAKATDNRQRVDTLKALKDLIKTWNPQKQRERLAAHRLKHPTIDQAIIATTATVEGKLWEDHKSVLNLAEFELWDASKLSSFAADHWEISGFFPGSPERIEKFRNHSIDAMREDGSTRLDGVLIDDLISEELQSSPSRALGRNTLIVGPPYIGKTCWAIRRAWRTCRQEPPSSVLWFKATIDNAEDLWFLNKHLPVDSNYILIIDDIHIAKDNISIWTRPVSDFVTQRPNRVRVVWIARDASIAEFLSVGPEKLRTESFPLEQVVGLFLERLDSAPLDLRVVAALESGLDPVLGRAMTGWTWAPPGTYSQLVEGIRKEKDNRVRIKLAEIRANLGSSYTAYLGLLPFGSIAFGVDEKFVAEMTSVGSAGLYVLQNQGVCSRSQDDKELLLNEHPFQLWQTLGYLDERGTEPDAVKYFARADTDHPVEALSEAVLCRYVQFATVPKDALHRLNKHAEWAGVPDPMASAARRLADTTSDDALRGLAREIAMKLARTAYPHNENTYMAALKKDLLWWEAQHAAAANNPAEVCEERRLDFILYEEAYIHYLCEDYTDAAALFRDAVDAGFRAIDRALDPAKRTNETIQRAQFALSNIWIAGLLERSAALRGSLRETLMGTPATAAESMAQLVEGIAAIYRALAKASELGAEGLESGLPFLDAARAALRPEHQYPNFGLTIDLREERYADFLRRHQLNAWLHSLETQSWPWLFGASSIRIDVPELPRPSLDTFELLIPIIVRDSRIVFRYQQVALLFGAAGGELMPTPNALYVAAMLRAAGSFEYLGDHLLLAWRTADGVDVQRAIAWFLRERVPKVGFNRLPELALSQLELR